MSLCFNLAQEGSSLPLHLDEMLHFADFFREESLPSKHILVPCKSWVYNPFHKRCSCSVINEAHFHTAIAFLAPTLGRLINFSASKTCRIGKALKTVTTNAPEGNHSQLAKNHPQWVDIWCLPLGRF